MESSSQRKSPSRGAFAVVRDRTKRPKTRYRFSKGVHEPSLIPPVLFHYITFQKDANVHKRVDREKEKTVRGVRSLIHFVHKCLLPGLVVLSPDGRQNITPAYTTRKPPEGVVFKNRRVQRRSFLKMRRLFHRILECLRCAELWNAHCWDINRLASAWVTSCSSVSGLR